MKHLGDITNINGAEIEPVWCITGGSPCQDLSVAGKRAGLAGARSGLFMEQVRIVKEMREHDRQIGRTGDMVRPRFLVWENVPGAFSSNFKDGFGDFGAVLEEIVRIAEPTFSLPRLAGKQKWTKSGAIDGDGWSVAWRTHDAQYWGVPQRRRRISVVADFGGQCAGEILFERESVSGHLEPGEPTRKEAAGDFGDGTVVNDRVAEPMPINLMLATRCKALGRGTGLGIGNFGDKAYTIGANHEHGVLCGEPILLESNQNHATVQTDGICTSLPAAMGEGGGYVPMVTEKRAYGFCAKASAGAGSVGFQEECGATLQAGSCAFQMGAVAYGIDRAAFNQGVNAQYKPQFDKELSASLVARGPNAVCHAVTYQEKTGCLSPGAHAGSYNGQDAYNDMLVTEKKCYGICSADSNAMKSSNPNSGIYEAGTSRTLDLNGGTPACNQGGIAVCEKHAYDMKHSCDVIRDCGEFSPTLTSRMGTGGNNVPLTVERIIRWIVRRLTPLECTRLQGFPDGWVEIDEWTDSKGKKHKDADSPKYKALGNSIAIPFWLWLTRRMAAYLPEGATLGSLFDGIGGFPLCWETVHGKGTARWASEIEEFPIAVTKARFGND